MKKRIVKKRQSKHEVYYLYECGCSYKENIINKGWTRQIEEKLCSDHAAEMWDGIVGSHGTA